MNNPTNHGPMISVEHMKKIQKNLTQALHLVFYHKQELNKLTVDSKMKQMSCVEALPRD